MPLVCNKCGAPWTSGFSVRCGRCEQIALPTDSFTPSPEQKRIKVLEGIVMRAVHRICGPTCSHPGQCENCWAFSDELKE